MAVKNKIAVHASSFYQENITPYEFVIAIIDKSDFLVYQIIDNHMPSSLLNVNSNSYYIFVYQIHPPAINQNLDLEKFNYIPPFPVDLEYEDKNE